MDVASLELCKELYALSGWNNGLTSWVDDGGRIRVDVEPYVVTPKHLVYNYLAPAYSLGYLVRKLPATIEVDGIRQGLVIYPGGDRWFCAYGIYHSSPYYAEAKNPEDAVAKLGISLIKSGHLTKES